MSMWRSSFFWTALVGVCFLALLPFLRFVNEYGEQPALFLALVEDDFYYFSRIKEVADGKPFIGNPYYQEHADETPPAFFVADWFAAAPQFLGFSINHTIIINLVLWSVIFFIALTILFLELGTTRNHAVGAAFIGFVASYMHVVRPVSMQIIFPFFILFCIALIRWLQVKSPRTGLVLAAAAASNFYIYTYSWQIVVLTLVIVCIVSFIKKEITIRDFLQVFIPSVVLSLPAVAYMVHQMNTPHYWETLGRIGLVMTRLPTFGVVIYGVPLLITAALVYAITTRKLSEHSIILTVLACIVPALFIAATSNIFLGKELETSTHVGRFMSLVALVCAGFAVPLVKFKHQTIVWKICVVFLLGATALFVIQQGMITYRFLKQDLADDIERQSYTQPLFWLEREIVEPSVILANPTITEYIPGITKHQVAFYMTASLHIMSNEEQIERYLISQPDIAAVTTSTLKNDIRIYAGTGAAIHRYKAINRFVRVCRMLYLEKIGVRCGDHVTADKILGDDYFNHILRTRDVLAADIGVAYDKYRVKYLLIDMEQDPAYAASGAFPVLLYNDGRFVISGR